MKFWDISRTLSNQLAPWPGDTPFEFRLTARIGEDAVVNVGAIQMSVHNGSHADAVFHFEKNGETIERSRLEAYFGSAVVIDLAAVFSNGKHDVITVDHLRPQARDISATGRVLLKTNAWPDSKVFPSQIPVIEPGVAEWFQANRVQLLGLDLPSVDRIDAKVLQNHHALARAGVAIVESLDLSAVEAGVYNVVALPLKITGGDAAPVRAVLWRD